MGRQGLIRQASRERDHQRPELGEFQVDLCAVMETTMNSPAMMIFMSRNSQGTRPAWKSRTVLKFDPRFCFRTRKEP